MKKEDFIFILSNLIFSFSQKLLFFLKDYESKQFYEI